MIDLNDIEIVPEGFDLDAIRQQLSATAAHWIPSYFPNGIISRDRSVMRCADLSGRAPTGTGSCVIRLSGPYAGWGCDFDTHERAGPIDLLGYATGLSGKPLFEEAARVAGATALAPRPTPRVRKDHSLEIERILKDCVPLAGTPAARYLETRNILDPQCPDLLFHPDLTDYETARGYNGLVAIIRDDDGEWTGGIHRTFLLNEGAGKAGPGKKMLGRVSGGSVRLSPMGSDGHLGIAEGIETALSAAVIFDIPCWAALSAGGVADWKWPAGLRKITIFADAGEAGIRAARKLSARLTSADIVSEIRLPIHGDDFNDDLKRGAKLSDYSDRQLVSVPPKGDGAASPISYDDFYAYMPANKFIYLPTRDLWPAACVNARLPPKKIGDKDVPPAQWLARHKPIEQMTWQPGTPVIIRDRIISDGGWIERRGNSVFNLYRPPDILLGDPAKAERWREHLTFVYPDETEHITRWLAHRVQLPGEKINHAIVLGGTPGIGKDTLLEPAKYAVGAWNFVEVSPQQMLGRFNGFLKAVILRVSEARDLGEVDRYGFYEASKTFMAAPPDVLRCDEKNLREHPIPNVCGVVITSNYKTSGLYLPADDRRHFVAWSPRTRADFSDRYWRELWSWYVGGGKAHVAAFLSALDLTDFDPKAPPPRTPAFWDVAESHRVPEDAELADVVDSLGAPEALTLDDLRRHATGDFLLWLGDRKSRRQMPHRLETVGYTPVRNDGATDGLWKIEGKRQTIYARAEFTRGDQHAVAAALVRARSASQ